MQQLVVNFSVVNKVQFSWEKRPVAPSELWNNKYYSNNKE